MRHYKYEDGVATEETSAWTDNSRTDDECVQAIHRAIARSLIDYAVAAALVEAAADLTTDGFAGDEIAEWLIAIREGRKGPFNDFALAQQVLYWLGLLVKRVKSNQKNTRCNIMTMWDKIAASKRALRARDTNEVDCDGSAHVIARPTETLAIRRASAAHLLRAYGETGNLERLAAYILRAGSHNPEVGGAHPAVEYTFDDDFAVTVAIGTKRPALLPGCIRCGGRYPLGMFTSMTEQGKRRWYTCSHCRNDEPRTWRNWYQSDKIDVRRRKRQRQTVP